MEDERLISSKETKIEWTKNYNQFQYLGFNRKLDPSRIEKIKRVIITDGFLVPILVNQEFNIIDGQHRLKAAESAQEAVAYIKYNLDSDKLPNVVSKLNSTAKSWTLENYMDMWSKLDKPSYEWMRDIKNEYGMIFAHFYKLCSGTSLRFGEKFKEGTIEFTESQKTRIINKAECYAEVRKIHPNFADLGVKFASAVTSMISMKGYNHEIMMIALTEYPFAIMKATKVSEYLEQLKMLYEKYSPKTKVKKAIIVSK